MKSWKVISKDKLEIIESEPQELSSNCVKLKILKSSISLTDMLIYKGQIDTCLPITIGRQGIAMVSELGKDAIGFVRGDRVYVNPAYSCGKCYQCSIGAYSNCRELLVSGVNEEGFVRDFLNISTDNLYKLPTPVRDDEALFIEQIAMALEILNKLNLQKGDHVVIVGATIVGLITAQLAIYYQAVPILLDCREDRLQLAKDLGVYYCINTVETDVYKKIVSLTGGRMAESCIHMINSSYKLSLSLNYVSRGAKVILAGWPNASQNGLEDIKAVVEKQLELIGVNNGYSNISSAINKLVNKVVNVMPLISKEIEFEDVEKTMIEMDEYPDKYIKVIVENISIGLML